MSSKSSIQVTVKLILLSIGMVFVFAGCGGGHGGDSEEPVVLVGEREYARGFDSGFADDSEYFLGYDESYFTVGTDPILYSGDLIEYSPELTYQAGVWDGQFEAYNDGYFVAYRFAFIIGFSEGYDNAFASDYLAFLLHDLHFEFHHGGFSDGYNDGFSEGRIFGAFDYETFLPFDWLDAFLDWEAGTDLYFAEVDKGTGEFGPVFLYEWGVNPHTLGLAPRGETNLGPGMRRSRGARNVDTRLDEFTANSVRSFSVSQETELQIAPLTTSRTDRDLTLSSTWLDRLNAYLATPSLSRSAHLNRSEMGRRQSK